MPVYHQQASLEKVTQSVQEQEGLSSLWSWWWHTGSLKRTKHVTCILRAFLLAMDGFVLFFILLAFLFLANSIFYAKTSKMIPWNFNSGGESHVLSNQELFSDFFNFFWRQRLVLYMSQKYFSNQEQVQQQSGTLRLSMITALDDGTPRMPLMSDKLRSLQIEEFPSFSLRHSLPRNGQERDLVFFANYHVHSFAMIRGSTIKISYGFSTVVSGGDRFAMQRVLFGVIVGEETYMKHLEQPEMNNFLVYKTVEGMEPPLLFNFVASADGRYVQDDVMYYFFLYKLEGEYTSSTRIQYDLGLRHYDLDATSASLPANSIVYSCNLTYASTCSYEIPFKSSAIPGVMVLDQEVVTSHSMITYSNYHIIINYTPRYLTFAVVCAVPFCALILVNIIIISVFQVVKRNLEQRKRRRRNPVNSNDKSSLIKTGEAGLTTYGSSSINVPAAMQYHSNLKYYTPYAMEYRAMQHDSIEEQGEYEEPSLEHHERAT